MYNFYKQKICTPSGYVAKFLLIMRLTTLILFTAIMQVCAGSFAQKISLAEKNSPLVDVFDKISTQSGYDFIVTTDMLKLANPVNIYVKDADLKAVLQDIFKTQPLNFSIEGKIVVVSNREKTLIDNILAYINEIDISGQVINEKGEPVERASIRVSESGVRVVSNESGKFSLSRLTGNETLITSYVGYKSDTLKLNGQRNVVIRLQPESAELSEVEVINTGYQKLSKERAIGSFTYVGNDLINRGVSKDILSRIALVVPGMYVNKGKVTSAASITIRGTATLNSAPTPLVVVDNFPYLGALDNINPDDVESITVLKDAAAASIWGSRSGNGVIVITTKKGKLNQKMTASVNMNTTIVDKPDLFKTKNFLSSSDYMEVEKYLFDKGYFNADLTNIRTFPAIAPGVAILNNLKNRVIDPETAKGQLDALAKLDVRNDFQKYMYQKSISQQYSANVNGGSSNATYALSAGYNKNRGQLVNTSDDRLTLRVFNTYSPVKNLELTTGINFAQSVSSSANTLAFGSIYHNGSSVLYPYAQFADERGKPLAIQMNYSDRYIDSVAKLGFLDWRYRPLDEMNAGKRKSTIKSMLFNIGAKYKIAPYLSLDVQYTNEFQSTDSRNIQNVNAYAVRNNINKFSTYNPTTKKITYNYPLGGTLTIGDNDLKGYSARTQVSFNKYISQIHELTGIAGAEIRERRTSGYNRFSYGYDDEYGTAVTNVDYITLFNTNPSGSARLTAPDANLTGTLQRYLSYFANASYTYNKLYTATVSGRQDGASLFGVKTNDKITPLWSAGLGWNVSNESFYHSRILPYLKMRLTYGFNGNAPSGSAYTTGSFLTVPLTGAQAIGALSAPNPQLTWEKVKNINLGFDFAGIRNVLYGSVELYIKNGQDLIQPVNLAPSVGYKSFSGNAAATQSKGIELSLNSKIIDRAFKWNAFLISNFLKDKVKKFDVPMTASTIRTNGTLVAIEGRPLYGVYGYKWGGLDPVNGDPQGYLNGKVSKDYSGIINNFKVDSLFYAGPSRPSKWGSLRNEFAYKGVSLSVMISYNLGYYFRRTSISGSYTDLINSGQHADYSNRWKNEGDELKTSIPSLAYNPSSFRNTFYQYSQELIEKGDHIRLQDIRLAYDLKSVIKSNAFKAFSVYTYATNLGLLWKANKHGLDPDTMPSYPNPFSMSFGLNVTF